MDVPTLIPESGGVTVTLIDANHCKFFGQCHDPDKLYLFQRSRLFAVPL